MSKNIVIIGNGISGVTCARQLRKLDDSCKITLISAETKYFYSRTALMYVYMGHMPFENTQPYEKWFWEKNRIELVHGFVQKVDTEKKQLFFSDGTAMIFDTLVLACGSMSNKFGWPGQELKGVQGLFNYQDLLNMEESTKGISSAVVVGGGLIGVEMAEMLHSRGIHVTFLVRENVFWGAVLPIEEAKMIERHIKEYGIDLRMETELHEIKGAGKVSSIITKNGEEFLCQFVGLTVGVSPNIEFLKSSNIKIDKGILINEYFETNIPNVYAIGDCAQFEQALPGRRNIEQVWYTGKEHGETVAHTILGNRKAYFPGNWFNSAKFFDIEYQTYGVVNATLKENEATFYWEHQDGKKSFRVVYDKNTEAVLGFNAFGIRLRHEICDRWITQQKKVGEVLKNLRDANFDPEFYKHYEIEIKNAFQLQMI